MCFPLRCAVRLKICQYASICKLLPDEASARSGISVHPDRREEFLWTLRVGEEGGGGGGRIALGVLSQLLEPGALPAEGARAAILRYDDDDDDDSLRR